MQARGSEQRVRWLGAFRLRMVCLRGGLLGVHLAGGLRVLGVLLAGGRQGRQQALVPVWWGRLGLRAQVVGVVQLGVLPLVGAGRQELGLRVVVRRAAAQGVGLKLMLVEAAQLPVAAAVLQGVAEAVLEGQQVGGPLLLVVLAVLAQGLLLVAALVAAAQEVVVGLPCS